MQLSRVALFAYTVAFLLGCASSPPPIDATPIAYPGDERCESQYTLRPPHMGFFDFMRAADAMVAQAAPEWYVTGGIDYPITLHALPNLEDDFGSTRKDAEGRYHVGFGRHALFLATIEDMAHVVLHEYVHVRIWNEILAKDWTLVCKKARHELVANKVVIEHYRVIGFTPYMLRNAQILYSTSRIRALQEKCPAEVTADMPPNPSPVESNRVVIPFDSFLVPNEGSSLESK